MTDRISAFRLLAYALPGLPLAILTLPVYVFVPTLYIKSGGLPPELVSFVLVAVRVLDAVTDPVMGAISDAGGGPRGRRKIWLVAGLPFTMAAVWFLFVPPAEPSALYFAAASVALTLAWTVMIIPYSAWGAELSGDYAQRTRVVAVREVAIVLGTLVATATAGVIAQADGGDMRRALETVALIAIAALPVAVLTAAVAVPDPKPLARPRIPFAQAARQVLANRPFLRLIAAFLINGLANGLPATLFFVFVSDRIGAPEWGGPLLFIYFLCGIAAVPGWTWLAHRIGKHRAWIAAMLWACAIFAVVPWTVGTGDIAVFVAITVLTGFSLGADLVLPPSMQADVVDVDRAESGVQRTGVYFALWSLATKLALALAVLAFAVLVPFGYDPRNEAHTEDALLALSVVYSLAPVVFKLAAIALMWGYPIDAARQAELRARIVAA